MKLAISSKKRSGSSLPAGMTMKSITAIAISLLFLILPIGLAGTLDGGTIFIADDSGSGRGQGVAAATDNDNLREKSLRAILSKSWVDGAGKLPAIAVITCSERPQMLLLPTTDRATIDAFLKTVHLESSGGTTISATLDLLGQLPGRPANIIYLGDGLLTSDQAPSTDVVRGLPAALAAIYGKAPRLHMIAIDSSRNVFRRTKPAWKAITEERVTQVFAAGDIASAIDITARNLQWSTAQTRPPDSTKTTSTPGRKLSLPLVGAICGFLAFTALLLQRQRTGALLNALITIEENGVTRRASARAFAKSELSIGEGCDVKVPKWAEPPIRLFRKEVRDRHGRKRSQTLAQHGNRSVILGASPASFSNGTTTIKVRGGR